MDTFIKRFFVDFYTSKIKWILSPYDEFAIEEALLMKQKEADSEVILISCGPERVTEALRTGLAMGADRAIHIECPESIDHYLTGLALSEALKKEESFDLIFTGKEAIDDGAAQVSQIIAHRLKVSCATVVLKADYQSDKIQVHREIEGGMMEVVELSYPALIAVQKGINEPRYASLPNIMKAKKKEIKKLTLDDLGLKQTDQKIRYHSFELPAQKQEGIKIEGDIDTQVKELVQFLNQKEKII